MRVYFHQRYQGFRLGMSTQTRAPERTARGLSIDNSLRMRLAHAAGQRFECQVQPRRPILVYRAHRWR